MRLEFLHDRMDPPGLRNDFVQIEPACTVAPARSAARAAVCSASAPCGFRRAGKVLRHDADARCGRLNADGSNSGRPVIAESPQRQIVHAGREQPDRIERPRITFHADRRQQAIATA